MIEAIKGAEKNRDGLTATAGRASTRNSIEEADDLFSQLDRFADEIEADDARRKVSIELDDLIEDRPDRFESRPDPAENRRGCPARGLKTSDAKARSAVAPPAADALDSVPRGSRPAGGAFLRRPSEGC